MQIAHVALWTQHLETLKTFYTTYFEGECGTKYTNPAKGFESYFIRFGAVALELMQRADHTEKAPENATGFCHLAFGVESRAAVCNLTEQLRRAGYAVKKEHRVTGDGYYESVVADPDGNQIEIVA
ncbi:MAG: VOC family protein [Alistipes sp.]|nr:VOC family protein [Alistipes sp.]